MNTRSQSNYDKGALYEVDIDFDAAIKAWRQNKKSTGEGQFKYITSKFKCSALIKKNGSNLEVNCSRNCTSGLIFCKQHSKS